MYFCLKKKEKKHKQIAVQVWGQNQCKEAFGTWLETPEPSRLTLDYTVIIFARGVE